MAGGEVADEMLRKINERIDSLADFPDRGVLQEDLKDGTRRLIEGKYLIYYSPYKSTVFILRVVHGARDLGELELG